MRHPSRIGPYRILRPLGEGGMGTVYEAEQEEPIRRNVAIKLIKTGIDSSPVIKRFEIERQALAVMEHESIARIYDCGASEHGQPYFAMELVHGQPITEFCNGRSLSVRERIDLFRDLCAGVQHAHHKGIVHRDLKPDNVLVTAQEDGPRVKIIDFGVARAVEQPVTGPTLTTESGILIGTPEYMSPEQATGDPGSIDTRTDIYSLGVILYELLTGELPFERSEMSPAALIEIQRQLREVEPRKPSAAVAPSNEPSVVEAARKRQTTASRLRRELAGDLDWIVLRAMAKEPERRYVSARMLAEDLERYLADEPVLAGPPSMEYRLRKFVSRYTIQVAAALVAFVALLAGGAGLTAGLTKASRRAQVQEGLVTERTQLTDRLAAKVDDFDRLAAIVRYARATSQEEDLYPPWPDRLPRLERWLREDCAPLLAMRPRIESIVARLAAQLDRTAADAPMSLDAGTARVLHDEFVHFIGNLDRLESQQKPSVEQRIAWARTVGGLTREHPNARISWDDVRESITSSPLYAGSNIHLTDQNVTGLVPLGANPVTGYQEFYHLRSAWDGVRDPATLEIPAYEPDGSIRVTAETGIVFVLLPGGTFAMGVQARDRDAPNYDRRARRIESHVHEITLAPFFVARHELTQGQWLRLWLGDDSLRDPSTELAGTRAGEESITLAHPVDVERAPCDRLLGWHGLVLPTEAQWEYACRAGTSTPWTCDYSDLESYANLADVTVRSAVPSGFETENWSDEYIYHAPVGTFAANAFGLHDVHGNVNEWCLDIVSSTTYGSYFGPVRAGDGLRITEGPGDRVPIYRGGSFMHTAVNARSGLRIHSHGRAGLRAARVVAAPDQT